jgi:hypothetical protein
MPNPFQIHGLATGPFFTDRAAEVKRITRTLSTPGEKLLLVGRRRMGKTSALAVARKRVERQSGTVIAADLSTVSTLADFTGSILDAASRTLGRRWGDVIARFAQRLQAGLRVAPDPKTGLLAARFDVSLRDADAERQRQSLERVLDTIEEFAAERKVRVGLILDEFQRIRRVGGDTGVWHLRAILQRHRHMSYVLAGSELGLIREMTSPNGAFFDMLTPLHVGPIDPAHFAPWIESRMETAGLRPASGADGVGGACLALAGPRTRDVVLLAHRTVEIASRQQLLPRARAAGHVTHETVTAAFEELVAEQDPQWGATWNGLTALQQNVLRAVAGASSGLTTGAVLSHFSLGATGTATNAAGALIERELLVKTSEAPSGYAFDNPFFRGWVIARALPDVGLHLPVTHHPAP